MKRFVYCFAALAVVAGVFTSCSEDTAGEILPPVEDKVDYDMPGGVFVLNEGNMTTENGSLLYITPDGKIIDNIYRLANGTQLGNVTQDMCINDGKAYIISQNGGLSASGSEFENDGMLVIADLKTMKRHKNFTREQLAGLDWPTHVAVSDSMHVYIRDNKGIWCLNPSDGNLTFVTGSEGAPKSRMVTLGDKIYTFMSGSIFSYLYEIDKNGTEVNKIKLPLHWIGAEGIAKADNNTLWVVGKSYGKYYMSLFDLSTNTSVKEVAIDEAPNIGASGISMAAKDSTVYYAVGTSVYRMDFSEAEPVEEEMVDVSELDNNALQLYNPIGVNPWNGYVYVNSIKGVGPFYTTNSIWVFDFEKSTETPVVKYDNYTSFPAGFFFNE